VSGTITSYEPGRKLTVATAEGEKTFDLASTSVNVPSKLEVGQRVTVTKSVLSDGRVSISVDRVR
jgi:hypothetical protein